MIELHNIHLPDRDFLRELFAGSSVEKSDFAVCPDKELATVAVFLIGCGWAFDPSSALTTPGMILAEETLHPLWLPLPAAAWPGPLGWPVYIGWILLGGALVQALLDSMRLRQRLPERLILQQAGPIPGPGKA